MKKFNQNRLIRLFFILSVALIAITLLVLCSRPLSLIDHSTRITSATGWYPVWLHRYYWLTNENILFFSKPTDGKVPQSVCFNVVTTQSKLLTGLNTLFREHKADPWSLEVSHDGKWIHWNGSDEGFITRLDGKVHHSIGGMFALWTGEGHQLAAFQEDASQTYNRVRLYDANTFNAFQSLSIDKGHIVNMLDKEDFLSGNAFMTPKYTMITDNWPDHHQYSGFSIYNNIRILRGGITYTPGSYHSFVVPTPVRGELSGLAYSHNGERIAWLFKSRSISTFMNLLHRIIPSFKIHEEVTSEIFVSAINGTHMHSLGKIEGSSNTNSQLEPGVIQWMPDGKHISFIYHDALWKISAK